VRNFGFKQFQVDLLVDVK